MLINNHKLHAEALAKEPATTFAIKLQNGLVVSGPSSLLPGLVRDAVTGGEVERNISAGPIRSSRARLDSSKNSTVVFIRLHRVLLSYKCSTGVAAMKPRSYSRVDSPISLDDS